MSLGETSLQGRCEQIHIDLRKYQIHFLSSVLEKWGTANIMQNPRDAVCPRRDGSYNTFVAYDSLDATQLVELVREEIGASINITDRSEEAAEIAKILLDHRAAFKSSERPVGLYKAYIAEINTVPGKTKQCLVKI